MSPWLRILALLLIFLASSAPGQTTASVLLLPNTDATGASDDYLSISLANGGGYQVDRLERDPLNLRSRSLSENLFRIIGRATDQAAYDGEVFFAPVTATGGGTRAALYVETAIGYAAYFENPGRGGKLGQVVTLTTRPFEEIAAADGNYALLMRQDSGGRTEGAFLYHATTGKAIYLGGLRKLEITPQTRQTAPLPALGGKVALAAVQAGSEATAFYVVLDATSGEIHFFDVGSGAAHRIQARKSDLDLFEAFDREGTHTSARRFVAVPVNASENRTEHVFIADAVTGQSAVLEFVTDANVDMRLSPAAPIGARLSGEGGARVFSAIPRVTSTGATLGLWLVDSQSRRTVYVDRPGLPAEMTVTPVTIERR